MNPLISVVIPTYNRKQIVLEAIKSALQQQPKNYEVIVVDDGSTDGTDSYLESLKLPIRIIRKENGGVSTARNLGIKQSAGKLIAFLDSDDLWLPGILKAQSNYLESHPVIPLVYVDQFIELKGKRIDVTRFTMKKLTHQEMSRFDLPGFAQSPPIHISSVLVRKSILDEVGYFNEHLKIHEDTDMWNRISEKYELGYIEKPLTVFRWEADQEHLLKPSARKEFMSEGRKYMKLYEDRRKNRELTEREKNAIKASYERMDKLEKLIETLEKGEITEEEFENKRQEISIN